MNSLIIFGTIILAIAIGERFRLNAGLVAVAFAYLLAVFVFGFTTDQVFALWPIELFMVIFGVSFFFSFAKMNGTLEAVGHHMIYRFRHHTSLIPLGLYLTAALLSGLGAGTWGSVPIVGAIALQLCRQTKMNETVAAISVILGGMNGGNIPFGPHGAIILGVLSESGFADQAAEMTWKIFGVSILYPLVLIAGLSLWQHYSYGQESVEIDPPQAFTSKQKQTLALIACFAVVLLLPAMITNFTDAFPTLTFISEHINLSFLTIIFGIIAYMMNLAPRDKVFDQIPWQTIWVACGMTFLISLGIELGITEEMAKLISYMPKLTIPIVLTVLCGLMSIFSSTIGVLAPLFFPALAAISGATGWPVLLLACLVIVGGFSTGASPFSDTGSLYLATGSYCQDSQRALYRRLLFKVAPTCMGAAVATAMVLSAAAIL
ncbi:SLC13 family permease [Aerococcus sp. UMB10185]|uniref:SLC13 family permease n=1 Tax=unclassified Aerococcus TaxID=2618060 RepID=UPI0008A170D2|nr:MULTISPECIES: SLC13 family permease [unclassified Aerococcus]MDK6232915.1 SLC13 family permease [Aerococcus sp. UMB10185]MDK6855805.1 SLC13 family permease [Aerococcus sp. UMB7533]MDK8502546.1 SLC13 family permease [Aerococcus sp. UMB1112A]OFN03278.1 hypothetical protein HMPREF2626_00905 [Aerococcus sp. HMSC062A02]OHO45313.1 hypothetical protein HMPREF2705_05590 [Aerococcus sp. HMSC035B07]